MLLSGGGDRHFCLSEALAPWLEAQAIVLDTLIDSEK